MFGLLFFGIPAAIIAKTKGFKALRWILALGIIGLITVICLKSAKAEQIDAAESQLRADKANIVGAWMCWINIALTIIAVIAVIIMNQ